MGENEKQPYQLSFNWFLRVVFQGSRVTSGGRVDAGTGVGRTAGVVQVIGSVPLPRILTYCW